MVDVTVIAMWAHPRALSTAFLRMMIERGDVTVVHEPLVTLVDWQKVELPTSDGGTVTAHDPGTVLRHLLDLGADRPVFTKDTLEYRHQVLYDHPEWTARLTHTFMVREPGRAISSQYALKPTMNRSDAGYEHQWDLFELARRLTGRVPVVIQAERLLADPAGVVRAWCAAVGLPYLPHALTWQAQDRPEWRMSQRWHVDASRSEGFSAVPRQYADTPDTNPDLRAIYDHHLPFYERLVAHAI